jgi:hypothetical protein
MMSDVDGNRWGLVSNRFSLNNAFFVQQRISGVTGYPGASRNGNHEQSNVEKMTNQH